MSNASRPRLLGSITLAAVATAVSCSRMLTRQSLTQAGLDYLADDAELVVSELVTNAVRASGPGDACVPWSDGRDIPVVRLRLVLDGGRLLIEVWDRDRRRPIPSAPTQHDEGGRGMFIVANLCARWDCRYPRRGGKVVWAELDLKPTGFARSRHGQVAGA